MNRRTLIKAAPVAALLPTAAFASTGYTVDAHILEMARAGAPYYRSGNGLGQNLLDIDWDLFEAAKAKADQAGITARDIFNALGGPQLTPDERIESAKADIVAALREKHPDFEINQYPTRTDTTVSKTGEERVTFETVIITATAPSAFKQTVEVQRRYGR